MILFALIILLQSLFVSTKHFSHQDQSEWYKAYRECGGHMQSPIFINNSQTVTSNCASLKLVDYYEPNPNKIKLENNGHTVKLLFIPTEEKGKHIPYITGATLQYQYQFEELHFHWGDKNDHGSEHVLNDVHYPLEMHMVHRNTKYENMHEALKHKDGLAVLAVLFELDDKKHETMEILLSYFNSVKHCGNSVFVHEHIILKSLMPIDIETYYTYKGSLTIPPCSEVVNWFVFPEPVLISFEQMDVFRTLFDNNDQLIVNNYRRLQSTQNREVDLRRPEEKRRRSFICSLCFSPTKCSNTHFAVKLFLRVLQPTKNQT